MRTRGVNSVILSKGITAIPSEDTIFIEDFEWRSRVLSTDFVIARVELGDGPVFRRKPGGIPVVIRYSKGQRA